MQVFVPSSDYTQSVKSLDNSRVLKQCVESTQLLDIMFNIPTKSGKPRKGWLSHPALIAWKNNPGALIEYTWECVKEAKSRGIKTQSFEQKLNSYPVCPSTPPIWLGDDLVHSSHRSRLLQKGWETMHNAGKNQTKILNAVKIIAWYKSFNWEELQDEYLMDREYQWPTDISSNSYSLKVSVSKDAIKKKELIIEQYGKNPYINL
jgi:Pyrimidine dimer DNA glycosylase